MAAVKFAEHGPEVVTSKGPLKGLGDARVVFREVGETLGQLREGVKIVWGEDLPLENREVDLDLIEPACMNRAVDGNEMGVFGGKPLQAGLTSVSGPVVEDPKHPSCLTIGRASHDIVDESVEGDDSIAGFATAEDSDAVHVQRGEIGPSPQPFVFVFDLHREAWPSRQGRMSSLPSLDAGFLIRADDEFVLSERAISPTSLVEIQDGAGFGGEVRVARENPTPMLPGADGVFTEPAPDGGVTDRGNKSGSAHVLGEFRHAPARQRNAQGSRQLASDGLNFDEQLWGERPGDAPDVVALPGLGVVCRRISFATGSPLRAERSDFVRFHRWKDRLPPVESSWRARPENTATYISELSAEVLVSLETSIVFHMGFFWASLALPFQYGTGAQRSATVNTLVYL